jgi:hypothetical protein
MLFTFVLLCLGCKPDLVVSEFTVDNIRTETDEASGLEYWLADARIVVKNQGDEACERAFMVHTGEGWKDEDGTEQADYGKKFWKLTRMNSKNNLAGNAQL